MRELCSVLDSSGLSKAAVTIMAALAGSGSWADKCAINPEKVIMVILSLVLTMCGNVYSVSIIFTRFSVLLLHYPFRIIYNLNAREHNKCLNQGHPSQAPDGQELLFLFSTNGSVTMPQLGELCITSVLIPSLVLDKHEEARKVMESRRTLTKDSESTLSTCPHISGAQCRVPPVWSSGLNQVSE